MSKIIVIDKELCIGCGGCASACEEGFDLGDDGIAFVKDQQAAQACEDDLDVCPAGAISEKDE